MPWGWECRSKFVKQLPLKPVDRRGPTSGEASTPGPQRYETPQIFCGDGIGYRKITRAPAYTFGHRTPVSFAKPVTTPYARTFNTSGMGRKGQFRIPKGVVGEQYDSPGDKLKVPGPGAYAPRPVVSSSYKRPPAYTMQPAARPPYKAWDMWTPPPNMYCPYIPFAKPPAYTLGYMAKSEKMQDFPAPGEHDPQFNFVRKTKPAYSFGYPFKPLKRPRVPAPNTYCEKNYMVSKRTIPAPSFGIRHTPYLGQFEVAMISSKQNIISSE